MLIWMENHPIKCLIWIGYYIFFIFEMFIILVILSVNVVKKKCNCKFTLEVLNTFLLKRISSTASMTPPMKFNETGSLTGAYPLDGKLAIFSATIASFSTSLFWTRWFLYAMTLLKLFRSYSKNLYFELISYSITLKNAYSVTFLFLMSWFKYSWNAFMSPQ